MRPLLVGVVGGLVLVVGLGTASSAETSGDGVGLFDPATGQWTVRLADATVETFTFGNPGDQPLMGDWDCDGDDGPGIYRDVGGSMWAFLRNDRSSGIADVAFRLGDPGDVAVAGDFNGDGCDSLAVFRPSQERFYVVAELPAGGAVVADLDFVFSGVGGLAVTPFAGDFDGDGTDGVGLQVVGSCCSNVLLRETLTTGPAEQVVTYGNPGDLAIAGDWDGNPDETVGVYRPAGAPLPEPATFYLRNANTAGAADTVIPLGAGTELPVAVGVPAGPAAPEARDDAYATFGNTELVAGGAAPMGPAVDGGGGVLGNDTGDAPLTASLVTGPSHGTLSLAADGSFTYLPDAAFRGPTDAFTYRVTSGLGGTADATVTIALSDMVWYVDNTASGAGRSVGPFATLAAAEAASAAGDAIFVYAGDGATTGYDAGITLQNGQRLIGEAAGLTVQGTQLVPAGTRPQLSASGGVDTVTLAADNTVAGLALEISGTGAAIAATGPAGTATITDVDVTAASSGIDLQSTTGAFTFAGVDVASSGDLAVNVGGGSATVDFDAASSITATDGNGFQFSNADGAYTFAGPVTLNGGNAGIDIVNGSSGTFTFDAMTITSPTGAAVTVEDAAAGDVTFGPASSITQGNNSLAVLILDHGGSFTFDGAIQATNGSGLVFDNADGTYRFDGPVTLNGGNAGIDILNGSAGAFTFGDTAITNPGGAAVEVANSGSGVTFGPVSSITQGNAAEAVKITADTGTFTFDGTLAATSGTGLQFDDADGTYRFDGPVTLNGGDAGIDILNGSTGTFTFGDTAITSPVAGAVRINGGSADVDFGAGSTITQTGNPAGVNIRGGHSGTVSFAGPIDIANVGIGIVLGPSSGTYTFSGPVTVTNTAGAVSIGDSTGTFVFASLDVTDPIQVGIDVFGGSSQVTVNGGTLSVGNNAKAVSVSTGHAGSVTFAPATTIGATNGTGLQFDDADGTYRFEGPVTLNGGDAGIDILNGSAGTFTFDDATITDPTGAAFMVGDLAAGGGVDFTGTMSSNGGGGLIDVVTTAAGSTVDFHQPGAGTLTAASTTSGGISISDADGDVTVDVPVSIDDAGFSAIFLGLGDGTYTFRDVVITNQRAANAGVDIIADNSTVNFTNLDIQTDGTAANFGIVGFLAQPGNVVNVFGADNDVSSVGGPALVLSGGTGFDATFDTLSSTNSTLIGPATGKGIEIFQAGTGTLTVTGTTTVATASDVGIDIEDVAGTITFADVDVSATGGDGIATGTVIGAPATVSVNGGAVDSTGGDGVQAGSTGFGSSGVLNLDNTTFTSITGFVANLANSTVGGSGNVAVPFSCSDGGGNIGSILFNAGADSCP